MSPEGHTERVRFRWNFEGQVNVSKQRSRDVFPIGESITEESYIRKSEQTKQTATEGLVSNVRRRHVWPLG